MKRPATGKHERQKTPRDRKYLVWDSCHLATRANEAAFGVHVGGWGISSRMIAITLFYVFLAISGLFLVGWIVPVGIGIYPLLHGR
jgi:hypothetical protein